MYKNDELIKILGKIENILPVESKCQQFINNVQINLSFSNYIREEFIFKIFKHKILLVLLILFSLFYLMPNKLEIVFKATEKYIKYNLAGNLSHSPSEFYNRINPEISIVISTFNGEIYLKPAIRSIQNQNFLNIEIIVVDDGSSDNSVGVIKELMEEDRRIKLLSNGINRGTLYTKSRGFLNSKGKYVMTLDHDNLYANKDIFNTLYREAEKYNLDLLGFSAITTGVKIINIVKSNFINYFKTEIIRKPYLKKRFLGFKKRIESGAFICLYFIKANLMIKAIKQIGEKFINRNIDAHDDSILMFILSRNAVSLKHLKEIYYIILEWPEEYLDSLKFQKTIKHRERERKNCYSFLTFIEILITFTDDSDKFIAEKSLFYWFLRRKRCRNNIEIKDDIIRVFNLFLNNKYISSYTKKEILLYLDQTKNQNIKIY